MQPNELAFGHRDPVQFDGPRRLGQFAAFDAVHRLDHRGRNRVEVAVVLECQHGGDALGDRAGRDDGDFLRGQRAGLLGGEQYVFIIGQDDDFLDGQIGKRGQDFLRAGVHALPARHDRRYAQAGKHPRQPRAGRDRNSSDLSRLHLAEFYFPLGFLLHAAVSLLLQILDGYFRNSAELERKVDRIVPFLGGNVDVEAVEVVTLADLDRGAHGFQVPVKPRHVQRGVGRKIHHHFEILPVFDEFARPF